MLKLHLSSFDSMTLLKKGLKNLLVDPWWPAYLPMVWSGDKMGHHSLYPELYCFESGTLGRGLEQHDKQLSWVKHHHHMHHIGHHMDQHIQHMGQTPSSHSPHGSPYRSSHGSTHGSTRGSSHGSPYWSPVALKLIDIDIYYILILKWWLWKSKVVALLMI